MTLTRATLCLGLSAALLAGCASPPRADSGRVDQPVGSAFVRIQSNTGSYGSGQATITSTRMAPRMWKGQQVAVFATAGGPTLLQAYPHGSFVALVSGDTPVISFDPPSGYEWPIHVGKTWTSRNQMTIHAANQVVPVEAKVTVEAYEDVTMPAGIFKAFRIRTTDNLGNDDVNWFSPELGVFVKQKLSRSAGHASGPGTRETELLSQTIRR